MRTSKVTTQLLPKKTVSEQAGANVLPAGNILVVTRVGLGKVAVNTVDLAFSQDIQGIILKAGIDNRYLVYVLSEKVKRFKEISRGATIKGVTRNDLVNISLPLPPLHVQQQIADTLDKADALRRKDQELLQKYDELVQAIFYDMFGDPAINDRNYRIDLLENLCETKGQYGSGASATNFLEGGYRYVRITDINEKGELNDTKVSASIEDPEPYVLRAGDILFARSGATVGKTYLYDESDGPCVFAGYLIRFRPQKDILHPHYLFYLTKTAYYKAWVRNRQNVVAQPNINAQQYGTELEIPVPPLDEQAAFVEKLEKIRRIVRQHEQTQKSSNNLFKALLTQYFS